MSEAGRGGVQVEPARPEDAASMAGLAAASLLEPWSAEAFGEEIETADSRSWVIRGPAGEVAGFLVARRVLDELAILALAVAADARRRGLGRALVAHALAREVGLARVHLEVRSDDPGARAFYAALAFRPVGLRPGFYRGGVDAVTMSRVLAPPA